MRICVMALTGHECTDKAISQPRMADSYLILSYHKYMYPIHKFSLIYMQRQIQYFTVYDVRGHYLTKCFNLQGCLGIYIAIRTLK